MKRLAIILAILALSACGTSDLAAVVGGAAGAKASTSCRDRLVRALESSTPVHGAFNCLDDHLQAQAAQGGITSDKDLADNATVPPVYAGLHLLGHGPSGAYEYQLTADGAPAFMFIWLAADGRVRAVHVIAA